MSPASALQDAILTALAADTALITALGSARRLFDAPPPGMPLPYVLYGPVSTRDWSTGTDPGAEHIVTLTVRAHAAARRSAHDIATIASAPCCTMRRSRSKATASSTCASRRSRSAAKRRATSRPPCACVPSPNRSDLRLPPATRTPTPMSAQKGKDLLLKLDSDGTGTFVTVAGLRSRSIALNTATVDVTHAESAGRWRELLAGPAPARRRSRAPHLQGCGLRCPRAPARLRRHHPRLADRDPGLRRHPGPLPDHRLEFSGRHDAEVAFDLSLESAGELTFTAL